MGRPPVKVNPIRGERFNIIIKELDMNQDEFGKTIDLCQQQVCKIVKGHANLTEDRARRVVEVYPQYNLLWLLGQSDNKTLEEEQHSQAIDSGIRLEASITVLDTAYKNVCQREGIDAKTLDNIPELCILQSQLEDFAEMLMRNYLYRNTSHFWNTLDSFTDAIERNKKAQK